MSQKIIEIIKLISGSILLLFAILGGITFYLEGFKILNRILYYNYQTTSFIWLKGDSSASNAPIFLGLCGIAGAYLLASVKFYNNKKNE